MLPNALYPLSVLPDWMQFLVLLNPATYLIDALRVLAFGAAPTLPLFGSVLVVLLLAVVGVWLALVSFQHAIRREG
ncbi:MAG: hypothetical protein HC914_22335 [Chloroflexaceae bacterium]|nr:hypothetical protein [Chloroflexaceae bacterium]